MRKIIIIESCGQCTDFECAYRTAIGSKKKIPNKCPLENYPCHDCEFRDERDQYLRQLLVDDV